MRKRFYIPVVLIGLFFILVVFATSSGPLSSPASPAQTPSGTGPVGTGPVGTASSAGGTCRLALLLPGQAADAAGLQAGVKAAADSYACQLDVSAAAGSSESMLAQLHQAVQKQVTGILIEPIDQPDVQASIQQTGQAGLPVIVIGPTALPALQATRVLPDFIAGAKLAASFICRAVQEQGVIVQLVDSRIDGPDGRVSKTFSDGIQATCPAARLISVPLQSSGADPAKAAMLQVLSANPDISAVFAYTDTEMDGVFNADQQAGMLGVVTSEFGQESGPAASDPTRIVDAVLRSPAGEIGKAAVQAALAQAGGASSSSQINVPMQISFSDVAFQLPPDPTARPLTVGVILPDGADPLYQQMYGGLLVPARALDSVILKIRSGNNDPHKMIQELDWLVNAKVNAILISPVQDPDLISAIERVVRSGTPVVTLGLHLGLTDLISQVSFDEYDAGYSAGEYLCSASAGKGTLADVYDNANPDVEALRSRGLQEYQQKNCPAVKIVSRALPSGSGPACQGLQEFISEAGPFTGVFAHSDELGLCAVASSKAGFVVGIGDTPAAIQSIQAGKLSATVGQYPQEMGQIAMETTLEYLYGKPVQPDKPFPVKLITRESLQ